MEPSIQRLLSDKLYDKRKTGALEYVLDLDGIPPALFLRQSDQRGMLSN